MLGAKTVPRGSLFTVIFILKLRHRARDEEVLRDASMNISEVTCRGSRGDVFFIYPVSKKKLGIPHVKNKNRRFKYSPTVNSRDESRDNKLRLTATAAAAAAAIDPSSPSALERQTQLVAAATLRNSVKQEFQLTRGSRERQRRGSSPPPDARRQRERDQQWILEQSEVAEENLRMRYVPHDVSQQGDHRRSHQLGAQSGRQQFLRHVLQALLQVLHVQVLQPRHKCMPLQTRRKSRGACLSFSSLFFIAKDHLRVLCAPYRSFFSIYFCTEREHELTTTPYEGTKSASTYYHANPLLPRWPRRCTCFWASSCSRLVVILLSLSLSFSLLHLRVGACGLVKHVNAEHNGVRHACNVCGKKYKFKSSLQFHIDSMHRKNAFVCDTCGKEFPQKVNLKIHVNAEHNGVRHACNVCGKKYKFKSGLKFHIDSMHRKIALACDICGKEFSQKGNLKIHVNAEHNCVKHSCDLCGKKYKYKRSLKFHTDSFHRKIAYACNICEKTYTSKQMLRLHKDSTHRKIRYACDICGKKFKQKATIGDHIKAAHADITRDSQKQTSKFESKLKVRTDSSVHNGVTQSSCNICGKTFARKAQLRIHTKTAHNGVKPAPKIGKSNRKMSNDAARNGIADKRQVRAKRITSRDTRKNRTDAIRKAVGHSCDVCGKTFGQQSSLRIHIDSAHNDVGHSCDVCGEKFMRKATLKRHVETAHEGHTCGTCGKTFKLRIQLLTHNRAKHVRDTAGKSFLNKSNPKSHVDTALPVSSPTRVRNPRQLSILQIERIFAEYAAAALRVQPRLSLYADDKPRRRLDKYAKVPGQVRNT
ncbi:unnamed protein product [Trichogramma brassicae]|uniref:C2H2-type domain-containing protein n=1 Tax=Trichogramma brassicae TaxID=86971 RepID=A0A6H5IRV8_9HYME|nr:unnamed protein product [Trichogramma brassicae]